MIFSLPRPNQRRALAALAPVLAGVLLVGCGSGSSPGQSAAARERSQEAEAEKKFADYAKCLRQHGVNAEVISSPGEGHGLKVSPGREGAGEAGAQAAERDCARYRPEPKQVHLSPQQEVERQEAVERFAKCMREHGIKLEASSKGGGIQINLHVHPGEAGAPNPKSPAFQKASGECQKLLPGGGPGHGRGLGLAGATKSGTAGG